MHWQIQEAKKRFSEFVRGAEAGVPQYVTHHGKEVAVLIDIAEFQSLTGSKPSLLDALCSGPDIELPEVDRSGDYMREVDFGLED